MAKAAPGVNLEMDGAWISNHKVWRVSSSGWDGRRERQGHKNQQPAGREQGIRRKLPRMRQVSP
jgi:hypothetical protein